MSNEDISAFLAKPGEGEHERMVREIRTVMGPPDPQAEVDAVAEEQPKTLTEVILSDYAEAVEAETRARIKRATLRDLILKLAAGHVREGTAAQVGEWVATFAKQERVTVDWKRYVEDQMGAPALDEAKAKYGERTESVSVKVQRVKA